MAAVGEVYGLGIAVGANDIDHRPSPVVRLLPAQPPVLRPHQAAGSSLQLIGVKDPRRQAQLRDVRTRCQPPPPGSPLGGYIDF
ncbi:hypothetical protein ES703_58438 [subsurface metagenome]